MALESSQWKMNKALALKKGQSRDADERKREKREKERACALESARRVWLTFCCTRISALRVNRCCGDKSEYTRTVRIARTKHTHKQIITRCYGCTNSTHTNVLVLVRVKVHCTHTLIYIKILLCYCSRRSTK